LGDEEGFELVVNTSLEIPFSDGIVPSPTASLEESLLKVLEELPKWAILLLYPVNLGHRLLDLLRVRESNIKLIEEGLDSERGAGL